MTFLTFWRDGDVRLGGGGGPFEGGRGDLELHPHRLFLKIRLRRQQGRGQALASQSLRS